MRSAARALLLVAASPLILALGLAMSAVAVVLFVLDYPEAK